MGDMFSKSDASTKAETKNNQIGQQGAPGSREFAISGSTVGGSITVTDADPEVAKRGLDVAGSIAASSLNNVTYALDQMRQTQQSADLTIERITSEALQASPAIAESGVGPINKNLLIGGVVLLLALKFSKK